MLVDVWYYATPLLLNCFKNWINSISGQSTDLIKQLMLSKNWLESLFSCSLPNISIRLSYLSANSWTLGSCASNVNKLLSLAYRTRSINRPGVYEIVRALWGALIRTGRFVNYWKSRGVYRGNQFALGVSLDIFLRKGAYSNGALIRTVGALIRTGRLFERIRYSVSN